MLQRYWMVHNASSYTGSPNVKHPSKTQARKEAKRLAESNPGTVFAVLEAIDAFQKPTGGAIRIAVGEVATADDDIAF